MTNEKMSAYADMSRIVRNSSRSWDVYDPDGNHIATVRTEKQAKEALEDIVGTKEFKYAEDR